MGDLEGFLAVPAPGTHDALALQRKVRLLALRTLLQPADGPPIASLQRWLTNALQTRPDDVVGAAGSPHVLPFLLSIRSGFLPFADAVRAAVPSLLAELAARAGPLQVEEPLVWTAPVERLVARGALFSFTPAARAMVVSGGETSLELADGSVARLDERTPRGAAGIPLAAGPELALLDVNPLVTVEGHPEKSGSALSLGDASPEEWKCAIDEACALLAATIPAWHEEFRAVVQRIVPVGSDPETHFSASYREAPGTLYISLHPDPLTMAEAIVHETQHTKLNLLSWIDPVLRNGQTFWTRSPVRPDVRPLAGVLLAAHAFVPVSVMHLRLANAVHPLTRDARFEQRRRDVLLRNATAVAVVRRYGDLTPAGERVVSALEETLRQLGAPAAAELPEALMPA